jgi:hypothetical protein
MLREESQQFGAARHLEIGKIKPRGDRADDEGVTLSRFFPNNGASGLPMSCGNNLMSSLPRGQIVAEKGSPDVALRVEGHEFEGIPAVEVPDLVGRDTVPCGKLSRAQQEVDRRAGRPPAPVRKSHPQGRSEGLGIEAPLGMGLQAESCDDLMNGKG